MKQLESLREFTKKIKQWKPTCCPCRYANYKFIKLSFFKKVFSFSSGIIFSNVNIISCLLYSNLRTYRYCIFIFASFQQMNNNKINDMNSGNV